MSRQKLKPYPEVFFSLAIIACIVTASFMIANDMNGLTLMKDGCYWSIYYLNICQQGTPYVWIFHQVLNFTSQEEIPGRRILADINGERIGYWNCDVDVHGHHILRVNLFDAIDASFVIIEGSDVIEGRGRMTIETKCEAPCISTKFLLVKNFRR